MQKFKVYRRDWRQLTRPRTGEPDYQAEMVPVLTISAKTAAAALRIAKQKNIVAPIVAPAEA